MRNDYKQRPRPAFRGGGIALRGLGAALRGGGIAQRGMGVALAKGGKAFGGKETYGEELAEAKSVKSGKTSPKAFVKKEKAEKHKGEELKGLAKQAKAIKSGKKSPESYAKEETAEYMKKGGKAKKKK
jgi:hypothetical protein